MSRACKAVRKGKMACLSCISAEEEAPFILLLLLVIAAACTLISLRIIPVVECAAMWGGRAAGRAASKYVQPQAEQCGGVGGAGRRGSYGWFGVGAQDRRTAGAHRRAARDAALRECVAA